jgi:EAL domain-containing protein (putative c-di-GMP-specific phosphodiesterase class I)
MTNCAGPCACERPLHGGSGDRMLLWTANRATMRRVAQHAERVGATRRLAPALLEVRGDDLGVVLDVLDEVTTAPEADDVRVAMLDGGVDRDVNVERMIGASSLALLAARRRDEDLVALLDDPSRFFSVYQPIIDVRSGAPVAYEALLRARGADGGVIAGGVLFGSAVAGGWTHALDRLGRESAIEGAAGWLGDARLFVNFLPSSIYRPEICLATTMAACARAGIRADRIVFEVVETERIASVDHLLGVIDYYRAHGSAVALDDVGEGHGTLGVVARLRPDVVKIDMGIVRDLPSAPSLAVARAVIGLAHEIGAEVVAEGVETAEQFGHVQELGADLAQGWYIGRPEPAEALR